MLSKVLAASVAMLELGLKLSDSKFVPECVMNILRELESEMTTVVDLCLNLSPKVFSFKGIELIPMSTNLIPLNFRVHTFW